MATVHIPSPLRRYTEGQNKVQVDGATVADLLEGLETQYPGVKSRLFDSKGQLKRYVNLFVGDEEIRALQGLDTPVPADGKVSIIPAMAGGWA